MKIVSTSNGFVGALDVVRVQVLFSRFGLGHESCGGSLDFWDCRERNDLRENVIEMS
jgi:hypothetical protein